MRSWRLSAWLHDVVAVHVALKGPVLCLIKLSQDKDMTGGKGKSSMDVLRFLTHSSLETRPSQLFVPTPVFLGITRARGLSTSDTNTKP